MEELKFNCVLACAENYRDCFVYHTDDKQFIKVDNFEMFQLFDEFFVFSYLDNSLKNDFGFMKFTDHITGGLLGIFPNKESLIEKFEKIGREKYANRIKETIRKIGYSPAYRLVIQ